MMDENFIFLGLMNDILDEIISLLVKVLEAAIFLFIVINKNFLR